MTAWAVGLAEGVLPVHAANDKHRIKARRLAAPMHSPIPIDPAARVLAASAEWCRP